MAKLVILAVLLILGLAATVTEAQPACASKLVPCVDYLNSTAKPPDTCCNAIKEAVTNELTCLCNLYNTPGLLASFNISVDEALRLTRNCGVSSDLSACRTSGSAPSPTSENAPPGTPGSDKGAADKTSWTAIASLLLFWVYMMLHITYSM